LRCFANQKYRYHDDITTANIIDGTKAKSIWRNWNVHLQYFCLGELTSSSLILQAMHTLSLDGQAIPLH
jgi:hypothetical protein